MTKKRNKFKDSEIMDALDASNYVQSKAAKLLGVTTGTLSSWILDSENLSTYQRKRVNFLASKGWDLLEKVVDECTISDKDERGHMIQAAKVMIDKAHADKTEITTISDEEERTDRKQINDNLNRLLKSKTKAKPKKKKATKKKDTTKQKK